MRTHRAYKQLITHIIPIEKNDGTKVLQKDLASALGIHRVRAARIENLEPQTIDNLSFELIAKLWAFAKPYKDSEAIERVEKLILDLFKINT